MISSKYKHFSIIELTYESVCSAVCVPAALGVTGDIVFQAVLLDLQRVVEGSIQLLHCHFDRALQANKHRIMLCACGAVDRALVLGPGEHRFKPHCSQHVVVSLRHFTPNCSCGDCPQY